ncbi:response regulator [Rhodanobacter hydrolyticus]|uniref:Response regulator n=1 Tax=Rhodanobacter hydrolyticus TaxID=2250595 RepID=A0ABW8J0D4_9GAMM
MHSQTSTLGRVLVIEDDPVVAMVLEDVLQKLKLEVIVDLSLANALTEIESGEFDAVLLDMELRGESARPALLAMMAQNVPFVVISGSDQSALVAEFPQLCVLMKPVSSAELQRIVRSLLRHA